MSEPPEAPCPAPQRIKGLGVELPKLCRQNKETGVTGNKGGDEIGQKVSRESPRPREQERQAAGWMQGTCALILSCQ